MSLTSCQTRTDSPPKESSYFQKVTGDDPADQKSRWDRLFSTQDYVFGTEPAAWLSNHIAQIPVGPALDIAMGEGRNSVFLAKKGFAVEGVDISEVATRKALRLARDHGVEIRTTIADLNTYRIPTDRYSLIVNIQYLQRSLVPAIQAGLKKGGIVVYENTTEDELRRQPNRNLERDQLLKPGELRQLFSALEILDYREGPSENGEITARLVARKR